MKILFLPRGSCRECFAGLERSTRSKWSFPMSVSDVVRRDAEKTGELVRKKLLEIMDLQAAIDSSLRDAHPTPFGSKNWQYACIEALQRPASKDGAVARAFPMP